MLPVNITDPTTLASTSTARDVVSEANKKPEPPSVDAAAKKRHDEFRSRVDVCKLYRRKLIANWTISIDYRRGKPFTSQTDEDQISVNMDWSLTKDKQSALFSQTPQVRVDHPPQTLQAGEWIAGFERRLNDTVISAGIESAMDECLPDCINAAGVGVVLVSYEAITENAEVPSIDMGSLPPELQAQALKTGSINGEPIKMENVPRVIDHRYILKRVSPADFLWPINYTGSDFDDAPWVGRSGRITWAEAVQKFNLSEDDKDRVLGEDRPILDKLTHDVERDKVAADDMVGFDELFYKEFQYDTEAKSFYTIHHLVFVNGKEDPVIDEPWKGQRINEQNVVIGARKFPIRVLTLSYITDETIPPSDSAIGRPQVNEISKARTQMIRQRERSLPVRWFDVNRVDPLIQNGLMRGTWQAMIPVQGEGSRIIGEVARAQMPQETFMFDKIAKEDLYREFGSPTPVESSGGGEEPKMDSPALQTRIGRERAKVASFFVEMAEVLGSLMCLYEDPSTFGEGFDPSISLVLNYSILADSTVLVDANQKLLRLNKFLSDYAKSGWISIEPVLKEIASLSGLDASLVVQAPQPKPPVEPNISLRLTGVEDMLNPLTLAFLIKSGQAPDSKTIEQAKQLIQQAVVPPQGGTPGMPPQGQPPPGAPLQPPDQAPPPGGPTPSPPPPPPGESHHNWSVLPALNKRSETPEKQ